MLPSLPIEPEEMFHTRNSAYVTDMGKEESLRTDTATHEGAGLFGPVTLSQDTNYYMES